MTVAWRGRQQQSNPPGRHCIVLRRVGKIRSKAFGHLPGRRLNGFNPPGERVLCGRGEAQLACGGDSPTVTPRQRESSDEILDGVQPPVRPAPPQVRRLNQVVEAEIDVHRNAAALALTNMMRHESTGVVRSGDV